MLLFFCRRSNILDVEPIYTFRGHSAPVLSVVINSTSEMCFSGSADSTIICWSIPSLDIDPYGPYSKFVVIHNKPFSKMAATNSKWLKLNWAEKQYQHLKYHLLFGNRTKFG